MSNQVQRSFIIGGEWLSYKIYTGVKTADIIIDEIIKPAVDHLKEINAIKSWFFIRYSDPNPHLRLRFKCSSSPQLLEIINCLHPYLDKFLKQDLISRVQIDTYNREIERYGSITMELAESLFCFDSEMIVEFLSIYGNNDDLRWLFSLLTIDSLLISFKYTDDEKLKLLENLKLAFGKEFSMSRSLKKQLDKKYRSERQKIDDFMNSNGNKIISDLIKLKQKNIDVIAKNILNINLEGKLQRSLDDLMSSYIHMQMNRLFRSKNRIYEMVCYDFLFRFYKSSLARKKYNKS